MLAVVEDPLPIHSRPLLAAALPELPGDWMEPVTEAHYMAQSGR